MGRPKLLLPWGNGTVIGHLLGQWRGLGAAQIGVVVRPADAVMAGELERFGFAPTHCIENPDPARGMFSSILCAANWPGWQPGIAAWAIVLGDQPHLRPQTLRRLLEFQGANPEAICQLEFGGHARHPVLLPQPAWRELKTSRAETLKDFLKQTSIRCLRCPADDPGLALDLDTPEDYQRAREKFEP